LGRDDDNDGNERTPSIVTATKTNLGLGLGHQLGEEEIIEQIRMHRVLDHNEKEAIESMPRGYFRQVGNVYTSISQCRTRTIGIHGRLFEES
jgi:hypothetical protein